MTFQTSNRQARVEKTSPCASAPCPRPRQESFLYLALSSLAIYCCSVAVVFDGNRRFSYIANPAAGAVQHARLGLGFSVLVITSIYWFALAYKLHQAAWTTPISSHRQTGRYTTRIHGLCARRLRSILVVACALNGWAAVIMSLVISATVGKHWAVEGLSRSSLGLFAACTAVLSGTMSMLWALGALGAVEHAKRKGAQSERHDEKKQLDETLLIEV